MKSKSLLSILLLSLTLVHHKTNAQAFEKEKNYISASYGLGTFFGAGYGAIKTLIKKTGTNVSGLGLTTLGPIGVKYEYGVTEHIGIGLGVNYQSNDIDYVNTYTASNASGPYTVTQYYDINRTSVSVLARMNLHFGDHKKLDPYWGFGIGYRYVNWDPDYSFTTTDPNVKNIEPSIPDFPGMIPFGFETTFGVRYLFTPHVGAFAEAGIAKSFLQFGLTGKF